MTVVLAIAVVLLAAGLAYTLLSRPRAQEAPDLGPAIQEATSQVASQTMADLLRVNEESRKVDAQEPSEATLDKRQAEIKALAERIAQGQEKIEAEVQRPRAKPTCRPAPCSSRWARRSATSTPRPPA